MTEKLSLIEAKRLQKEIEKRISLRDYITNECRDIHLFLAGYKDGKEMYTCSCPFHKETEPSFRIYSHTNSYYCFGCKVSGGIVSFVKEKNQWSWFKTINCLARSIGLSGKLDEAELLEVAFEEYIKRFSEPSDSLEPNNINYLISSEGKTISRRFNYYSVDKTIDKIYALTDAAIIEQDRSNLYRIKNEILPQMKKMSESYLKRLRQLQELEKENKLCTACSLRFQCQNIVVGEGDPFSGIVILGEAPGESEDIEARPFIGRSGLLLRETIQALGYLDKDIWIDNVSNCRPPNNKFQDEEASICRNLWLNKRLEIIKPKFIMAMGANSSKIFLGQKTIKIASMLDSERKVILGGRTINVLFNYHPSFILRVGGRNSDEYNVFKNQLKKLLSHRE